MTDLYERSTCSALLITCSDFRFKTAARDLALSLGLADDYDLVARPGGIRSLVDPRDECSRETMRDEITLLHRLRRFTRVVALNHLSCLAYDDIAQPGNERAVHAEHLRRAKEWIERALPGVTAGPHLAFADSGAIVARRVE